MDIFVEKVINLPDIKKCMNIRTVVFVEGQNVPIRDEIDGQDSKCDHYLLKINNVAIGTARIKYIDNIAKIGRVAILKNYQKKGLGTKFMKKIITDIKIKKSIRSAKLSSQTQAIEFYKKIGFSICSEEYIEAGIPHKDMQMLLHD